MARSPDPRRLGDRFRERLRISSWCLTRTDSATTERAPPGPAKRAAVASRCRKRTARSRTPQSYQASPNPKKRPRICNSPRTASAAGVSVRRPCCECPGQLSRVVGHCGLNSPIMSGPSKKSSPSSGEPEILLVRVGRLRRQAEEFQRTVEEELRTTRALLEELHIREAKRRGHGRRMD